MEKAEWVNLNEILWIITVDMAEGDVSPNLTLPVDSEPHVRPTEHRDYS